MNYVEPATRLNETHVGGSFSIMCPRTQRQEDTKEKSPVWRATTYRPDGKTGICLLYKVPEIKLKKLPHIIPNTTNKNLRGSQSESELCRMCGRRGWQS